MSEDPLDLSSLDPTLDRAFDDRVSAIVRAARVGSSPAVIDYLSRWTRPALAAAAVIAVIGAIPLLRESRAPGVGTAPNLLGAPQVLAAIARMDKAPGVADLAEALGVEGNHGR
jgi:hypothetical protein